VIAPLSVMRCACGSVGDFTENCPIVLPSAKYRFLVIPGYEHEIITTTSLPSRLEFKFWSRNANEVGVSLVSTPHHRCGYQSSLLRAAKSTHHLLESLPSFLSHPCGSVCLAQLVVHGCDGVQSVLIRLFMINPNSIDVYVRDVVVPASSEERPTLADPAGTNQLHPQSQCCAARP
jgi:hypothetical protein